MARIKDLIAAIVSTGDGYEDIVRIVTAASHSAALLRGGALMAELNWVSAQDVPAIRAMAAQRVAYKKVMLKSGMLSGHNDDSGRLNPSHVVQRVQKFLRELQIRDELYYPFAIIASHSALLISTVDLAIFMAMAREQQLSVASGQLLVSEDKILTDNSLTKH